MQPADPIAPPETLGLNGTQVTLLGTAHVSRASAEQVRNLLHSGAYDAVAVELCPSRYNTLLNPDAIARMDLLQVLRSGKVPMVMAQLALGAFQQRIAADFGIEPGAEMRAAVEVARELHLPVLLIDREIGVTFKRVYAHVPLLKRANLIAALLSSIFSREKITEEEIERLKQGDVLERALAELAGDDLRLFTPLIDERDRYMAARLHKETSSGQHKRMLAVVGAGHLSGIRRELSANPAEAPDITLAALDTVPPPSPWPTRIGWLIVLVIATGFAIGFSRSPSLGWDLVGSWIVITGGLSAAGTIAALGHPLTVLSAFVAAPFTTLNPALSAGMVTATVELFLRKPAVGDFMRLRQDVSDWRGWWRNRVARILLVFFLSSLGAAIGTYTAGLRIFERLTS